LIRHDDGPDPITYRRLPFGSHHDGFIKPRRDKTERHTRTKRGSRNRTGCCAEDKRINDYGHESPPETGIFGNYAGWERRRRLHLQRAAADLTVSGGILVLFSAFGTKHS